MEIFYTFKYWRFYGFFTINEFIVMQWKSLDNVLQLLITFKHGIYGYLINFRLTILIFEHLLEHTSSTSMPTVFSCIERTLFSKHPYLNKIYFSHDSFKLSILIKF